MPNTLGRIVIRTVWKDMQEYLIGTPQFAVFWTSASPSSTTFNAVLPVRLLPRLLTNSAPVAKRSTLFATHFVSTTRIYHHCHHLPPPNPPTIMPGLIQRYNAVAEYSAFISTNPSSTRQRSRRDNTDHTPTTTRAAISDEAAAWYEAMCPPLEDVQDVIRRFHANPDLSQDRVFAFLAPIVVFGALFVVAVVAVQPHSFAHRILDNPSNSREDVVRFAGFLAAGILFSVVALKCIIWGIAELSSVILSMENKEERSSRESRGIPSSNLVLGGIFM
ncbi:hypothetical protein C8Q77DRAFT_1127912 [Trametes polyzona]|nr:hypothetical protein C8Q77DRAFT_1127912 [Trametes polyzona]